MHKGNPFLAQWTPRRLMGHRRQRQQTDHRTIETGLPGAAIDQHRHRGHLAARRPQRSEPLFLFDARRPIRAANTDMIDQVITHADLCARLAGGRLKLQVSRLMADALITQGRLAEDDYRLCDLTVIWDEAEGQVVQVRDDARVRQVIDHVRVLARGHNVDPALVETMWTEMVEWFIAYEERSI